VERWSVTDSLALAAQLGLSSAEVEGEDHNSARWAQEKRQFGVSVLAPLIPTVLNGLAHRGTRGRQTDGLGCVSGQLREQLPQNEWLGGRDSNPDTQIQSLSEDREGTGNQQLGPAECGEGRQNPQDSRNKDMRQSGKGN
jgi:hypothetical protein